MVWVKLSKNLELIHMVDKFSKETRSYVLSRIMDKDTKPEMLVRSYLFSRGMCFRKNDRRYPGSPDVVLSKYNKGCCPWLFLASPLKMQVCGNAEINVDFWEKKLYGNRERDKSNQKELESMGWTVITVCECQLKKEKCEQTHKELYAQIISEP